MPGTKEPATPSDERAQPAAQARRASDVASQVHLWIAIAVSVVMTVDLALVAYAGQWLSAFLIVTIMAVILAPTLLRRQLRVKVPAEFQVLALVFAFSALFLGEVQNYYELIWWWDLALHVSSGFLLGILGFLLVHVLNESARIDMHLRPRFVALFAFLFAVAVGALWEVFEFAMDTLLGTNMQKAMLDDPSGLTDTMWDLIVDMLGALIVSAYGWWYLDNPAHSFIERWVEKFVERNPDLFRS